MNDPYFDSYPEPGPPMQPPRGISDTRFYVLSILGMMALTVAALVGMSLARVDNGQIGTTVAVIGGFTAMLIGQWRSSLQADARARELRESLAEANRAKALKDEEVRRALEQATAVSAAAAAASARSDKAAAVATQEVKTTLETTDRERAEQLTQIQVTSEATHVLSNSKYGAALKKMAACTRRWADRTRDTRDIAEAELAESELKEHNSKQAVVDIEQDKNKAEGKPTA
jgi:hypothetical protein